MKKDNFRTYRNMVTSLCRKGKKDYFEVMIAESKNSNTTLWRVLDRLLPCSKGRKLPNTVEYEGTEYDDMKGMAEAFNKHFVSVGRKVTEGLSSESKGRAKSRQGIRTKFEFRTISREEIEKELNGLNIKKAMGIDSLPPRVLKAAAPVIAGPITHIFNYSLESGSVPRLWKKALVTPIHKAESMIKPDNYRPISVLPILSKLLENVSTIN